MRKSFRWMKSAPLLVALTACAAPRDLADPLPRWAGWFDHADARAVREACRPGAPEHWRLIYNGRYRDHVRSYELSVAADGGARLVGYLKLQPDLSEIRFSTLGGLLDPWRGVVAERRLSPSDMASLRARLDGAGVGAQTPDGLRLPSESLFWIVARCRGGQFRYDAWRGDQARWRGIPLLDWLAPHDPLPRPVPPETDAVPQSDPGAELFILTVGRDGLHGMPRVN